MGEVHPAVSDKYGIGTRAYVAELFFDNLVELSDTSVTFVPLPKYPAMTRDIALLADEELAVQQIVDVVKNLGLDIIKDFRLFDIYRGNQVPEGKKSMAFSITYRNNERTLTDDDVQKAHASVLEALKESLGVSLRD